MVKLVQAGPALQSFIIQRRTFMESKGDAPFQAEKQAAYLRRLLRRGALPARYAPLL